MLAKVTLGLLTSGTRHPALSDLRKTATVLNERIEQLRHLRFH